MRTNFRSFSTFLTVAFVATVVINPLSAQRRGKLGGTPAPAAAPAPEAPKPVAPAPVAPAEPAMTEERVREIAGEVAGARIANLPAPQRIDINALRGEIRQDVFGQIPAPQPVSLFDFGTFWPLYLLLFVFGLAIVWNTSFARGVRTACQDAFQTVGKRFDGIEARLKKLEPEVQEPDPGSARRPAGGGGAGRGLSAILAAMFVLSAATALSAPTPTVSSCTIPASGSTPASPAFFTNDGSVSDVVCRVSGLSRATAVTFSDVALTTTNVSLSGNTLKFKLTVGTAASIPSEPDMLVDGTTLNVAPGGYSIGIVDAAKFGELDFMYRMVRGSSSAPVSGSSASSGDMRWLAFFNGVCGTEKGKGKCGREYGSGITGQELFKQLKAAKTQAEEDKAMAQLAVAAEFNATDRTFSDPRFVNAAKATAEALTALNKAVQATGAEAKSAVAKADEADERAKSAQDLAAEGGRRVSALDRSFGEVQAAAAELREQLRDTRVPRRGPAGLFGATRRLVPRPQ